MNWIDESIEKFSRPDDFVDREAFMDDYDYNKFKDELRTALTEAKAQGAQEALKPFKGAKNPGEWEDSVWHDGKKVGTQEALAKVEEWAENQPFFRLTNTYDDLLHHLQQLKDKK